MPLAHISTTGKHETLVAVAVTQGDGQGRFSRPANWTSDPLSIPIARTGTTTVEKSQKSWRASAADAVPLDVEHRTCRGSVMLVLELKARRESLANNNRLVFDLPNGERIRVWLLIRGRSGFKLKRIVDVVRSAHARRRGHIGAVADRGEQRAAPTGREAIRTRTSVENPCDWLYALFEVTALVCFALATVAYLLKT